MITQEQEEWLAHLSDVNPVKIIPFDSTCNDKFEAVKSKIQSKLGFVINIEHHGATSLGISGQDEIDVYIPVSPDDFQNLFDSLVKMFSDPKSYYHQERARFVTTEDNKHIDIFLINAAHDGWLNLLKFEKYLKQHPDSLSAYENLKESGNGLSTREYYRRKIEFINAVLQQ